MSKHVVVLLSSGFVLLGIIGCGSSTSPTSTTITKVVDTSYLPLGSIMGHVRVLDSLYSFQNSSGAVVSLEGISLQTVTDSNGLYALSNVPAGTYILNVSKPRFGVCRFFNVSAIGPAATVLAPMVLAPAPILTIHLDSAEGGDTIDTKYFIVKGRVSDMAVAMMTFADLDSTVPPSGTHLAHFDCRMVSGGGLSVTGTNYQAFQTKVPSGTKLYITAAAYNTNSAPDLAMTNKGTYYDPLHNTDCFITTGPRSNVLTVIAK